MIFYCKLYKLGHGGMLKNCSVQRSIVRVFISFFFFELAFVTIDLVNALPCSMCLESYFNWYVSIVSYFKLTFITVDIV